MSLPSFPCRCCENFVDIEEDVNGADIVYCEINGHGITQYLDSSKGCGYFKGSDQINLDGLIPDGIKQ